MRIFCGVCAVLAFASVAFASQEDEILRLRDRISVYDGRIAEASQPLTSLWIEAKIADGIDGESASQVAALIEVVGRIRFGIYHWRIDFKLMSLVSEQSNLQRAVDGYIQDMGFDFLAGVYTDLNTISLQVKSEDMKRAVAVVSRVFADLEQELVDVEASLKAIADGSESSDDGR